MIHPVNIKIGRCIFFDGLKFVYFRIFETNGKLSILFVAGENGK